MGICSKRDNIVFQDSRQKLKELLLDFATKPSEELRRKYDIGEDSGGWKLEWAINEVKKYKDNLDDFIMQCHYRPFDLKWTFYTNQNCGFMARPVYDIFKHFLGVENVGLNVPRQLKVFQGEWNHTFIQNVISNQALTSGGNGAGVVHPLYLKQSDLDSSCHSEGVKRPKNLKQNRDSSLNATHFAQNDKADFYNDKVALVENFTQSFRAFIDTKYGQRFTPKVILGYIYAVLFHKDYREKFLDFLKIDFPRIPFVKSKEQFLALSALGGELINLHLKKDTALNESVGQDTLIDENIKDLTIQKISYVAQEKRLFINKSLHFTDVSKEVWEYKIGGYQVLETYLSYHKNEQISKDFREIIKILHKSLEIEAQIAKMALN